MNGVKLRTKVMRRHRSITQVCYKPGETRLSPILAPEDLEGGYRNLWFILPNLQRILYQHPMTKQAQYIPMAREVFNAFLDSQIDLNTLLERLREMELQIMADEEEEEDSGKGIWFRFFEGDPLQTTILDIERDLADPSHPNCRILLQGIAVGLEENELEVHYS